MANIFVMSIKFTRRNQAIQKKFTAEAAEFAEKRNSGGPVHHFADKKT